MQKTILNYNGNISDRRAKRRKQTSFSAIHRQCEMNIWVVWVVILKLANIKFFHADFNNKKINKNMPIQISLFSSLCFYCYRPNRHYTLYPYHYLSYLYWFLWLMFFSYNIYYTSKDIVSCFLFSFFFR